MNSVTVAPHRNILRAADELPERFNAAHWFVGRNVEIGNGARTAIVSDETQATYAELDALVRGYAANLLRQGLHAGDRIVLVLPDGLPFAVAFWGAIAAGCVAVPINPLLTPDEQTAIAGDCGAQLVLRPGDDIISAARSAAPLEAYAPTHRDEFAFFLYSSGTTGEPKGVVHLHHDMWVCARTYGARVLGIRQDDRAFSIAKLFFAYGLGNAQYFPLDVGATAILFSGRPTPEAVLDQVARHRPTLFFGVPTAYAQVLAAIEGGIQADFSSVRRCVSAGEALPPGIFERWRARTGLEIVDGIGSTEICHIFLSNEPGACVPGSSGKPVPGYDVRIVDELGGDVGDDEIGDLLVCGDSTMPLYWNKHERTKNALHGEWIRTGDKYWRDPSGVHWHAGRSDDMLKVSGIWVSPVEVEAALGGHAAVVECAVVARKDADGLVKAHAYVVSSVDVRDERLADDIRAYVKGRLAPYKCPRWITFVDELPKTATGKTRRFALRERS